MNTCYAMSLVSLVMLIVILAQSFFSFNIFSASPMSFLILTSIVYLFTETLIIFFFVGTGVSIRDFTAANHLSLDFHRQSIAIKRRIYPTQLLNILILMTAFILYGAADTQKISIWIYRLTLLGGIAHFIYAKIIQHNCFRDNTNVILKMSGLKPLGQCIT